MALSKTTQDHDEIRQWAEARGGKPAEVTSTSEHGTGILRLEFPSAANANDSNLNEISWDEFFEKFDASGLSLVYQEVTAEGAESNFNRLVYPENVSASAKKSTRKTAGKKAAPAKKATGAKTAVRGAAKKSTEAKKSSAASKKAAAPGKKSTGAKSAAKKTVRNATPAKKAAGSGTATRKATAKAAAKSGRKPAAAKKAPAKKTAAPRKTTTKAPASAGKKATPAKKSSRR